jgi:Tol biopolymer transport system component
VRARRVSLLPPSLYSNPEHSPSGNQIAFDANGGGPQSAIWVIGIDGTRQATAHRFPCRPPGGFASYSPNGRKVALVSDLAYAVGCCNDLNVMHADRSSLHRITTSEPGVLGPDWGSRS